MTFQVLRAARVNACHPVITNHISCCTIIISARYIFCGYVYAINWLVSCRDYITYLSTVSCKCTDCGYRTIYSLPDFNKVIGATKTIDSRCNLLCTFAI